MNPELSQFRRERAIRWLIPLFLTSGATSLVYETLWERQLHLVFGTSQVAVSTVLAAFMTGLALGGFSGAKIADSIRRPILAYAILEAAIGLYALIFPFLLEAVRPLYLGFFHATSPSPTVFGFVQFLMLGTLLLPPTFCMGMTLPLLSRFATTGSGESGEKIGRLYGANTIGAVIGTGLAGFVLLPELGLSTTTWLAAAGNGLLCLGAIALSRSVSELEPEPVSDNDSSDWTITWLGIIALLAGLSALIYEVSWFRLMALILGASAYAFSIMLFSFLLGIGGGGWIGGRWADELYAAGGPRRVLLALAGVQVGIAALSWAAMYLYGELPWLFVAMYDVVENAPEWLWPGKMLLAMLVMVPSATLMGAAFPLLVRVAAGESLRLGRPVGRLYGWNTLGAIGGAALGGLLLLPTLQVRGTVLVAIVINLIAGAIALIHADGAKVRIRTISIAVGGTVLGSGLFGLFAAPWHPLKMTAGTYKYVYSMEDRTRQGVIDDQVKPYELLYYAEGLSSVVTVARHIETDTIWLANNGKIDASSRADMPTQVLVSHMPFFYRPDSERVLMVGLAAGYSAGSITLHTAPTQIDLVEIEGRIFEASHFFDEWNHRPLEDKRLVAHVNDARNHLMLTEDGTYDLIVSEPSNPWLTGVSNLFTREYFELGRTKLAKDGIFSQWIQIYGMDTEDLRSLLGTFSDTFAYVHLFSTISDADLVLVGSDSPLEIDLEKFQHLIDTNEALRTELAVIDVDSAHDLLARFRLDKPHLQDLARDVITNRDGEEIVVEIERNTDDNMRVEYSAPLHLYTWTGDENVLMLDTAVGEIPLVPVEATKGAEDLIELARSYAELELWVQALMCLKAADRREPRRSDVEAMYVQYQKSLKDALTKQEEEKRAEAAEAAE